MRGRISSQLEEHLPSDGISHGSERPARRRSDSIAAYSGHECYFSFSYSTTIKIASFFPSLVCTDDCFSRSNRPHSFYEGKQSAPISGVGELGFRNIRRRPSPRALTYSTQLSCPTERCYRSELEFTLHCLFPEASCFLIDFRPQ